MKQKKLTFKKILNKMYDYAIQKLIRKRYGEFKPSKEEKERIKKLFDDYLNGKIDLKMK